MKTLLSLAVIGTCLCAGAQTNATLQIFAGDFTSSPQAARRFALFPVPNLVAPTNAIGLVTGDYVGGITDTNGNATLTNVPAGTYRLEFHGTTVTTTNYLLLDGSTNFVYARDRVTLYPTGLGFLLYEEAGVVGGKLLFEP